MKNAVMITLSTILILLSINCICLAIHIDDSKTEWVENIYSDFENYGEVFQRVAENETGGGYHVITAKDYEKENKDLKFIFEELKYKEIKVNIKHNVFFNKYHTGLAFRGLVYMASPEYVDGAVQTETYILDDDVIWAAHYDCP